MEFENVEVSVNDNNLGLFKSVVVNDCEARLYNGELDKVIRFDTMYEEETGSLVFTTVNTNHYYHNGIMAWDVIDEYLKFCHGLIDDSEAFYLGNILKYLFRLKTKGQFESDINKIKVYCDRLLEHNK